MVDQCDNYQHCRDSERDLDGSGEFAFRLFPIFLMAVNFSRTLVRMTFVLPMRPSALKNGAEKVQHNNNPWHRIGSLCKWILPDFDREPGHCNHSQSYERSRLFASRDVRCPA